MEREQTCGMIAKYWSLDRRAQQRIRCSTHSVVAHGSQFLWRVTGEIGFREVNIYCDCIHCDGHPSGEGFFKVDMIVSCDEEIVIANVEKEALADNDYSLTMDVDTITWNDGPHVERVRVWGNE